MIRFRDFMENKVKEYYSSRVVGQDFFTAPQLDRIFGEVLADFITPYLQTFENPAILELGAGTGQLAYDILSHLRRKNKDLYDRLSYRIYDFSPRLVELQKKVLRDFSEKVAWVDNIPHMEGCVIANEFFDCLPVHVLKKGKELYVDQGKELWKDVKDGRILDFIERMGYQDFEGTLEVCLDCIDFLKELAQKVKGYLLIIDYGYTTPQEYPNGSVVGYKSHRVLKEVLSNEVFDITAHVNFSALMEYGRDYGLKTLLFQSLMDFLVASEVFTEELKRLSSKEDAHSIERLSRLKTMLLSMGPRFKVLFQSTLNSSS